MTGRLSTLQTRGEFAQRHIGPTASQVDTMLAAIKADSLQQLIESTVPASILRREAMDLPAALSEAQALEKLRAIAAQNQVFRSHIGMGYYDTFTPTVILRNVLENPGWYTAYTPYQPEISQGRLEALLNYQQMVMDLTGMELANASLLDEGTAAAEAMTLCLRVNKKSRAEAFFIASDCHPQTIAVVRTRAHHLGLKTIIGDPHTDLIGGEFFGALLQYPGTYGDIIDPRALIEKAHAQHTLVIVAADLLSLTLLTPPGEMGADVVVGNSQRFGVPMGYGGPHAAFFATRDDYKRSAPGRIIGVSIDRHGQQALRMAMQTREQHIRREKATSNICTAQALLSICAAFFAIYHGPAGVKSIAQRVLRSTQILATGLQQLGFERCNNLYFDTLTIKVGNQQAAIIARAEAAQINLRRIDNDRIGISLDETTQPEHIAQLWQIIAGSDVTCTVDNIDAQLGEQAVLPATLQRSSTYLTHPTFNSYHSETEILRYMKRLENKDIALNQAMIALGSCTMKLNATAEMIPITWPEFNRLHPFAPLAQAQGYQQLFRDLEKMLIETTGYDAVSLQPNAGSQGEYAGLLAIKRYHESLQQAQRDIVLIPSSAHGTNPASAALAGLKVVIVECDDNGNVDIADLTLKAQQHSNELCALMATYPSTHGVFEEGIVEICEIVHRYGGQVYVDGANLNALVGLAAPGKFGADVSHINLHKTFCIPHGGGGPGMGPIGVAQHLAPFLPSNPVQPVYDLPASNDTVSAAPWGSASILPISWMYAALMGPDGLTRATQIAILNANYVAERLREHFPVLYTGRNGRVAHECIIDLRPLKEASGIAEEDVAKRLMDFGFHAPTMSFPVPGTLMIEPTESESLEELDRFCAALIHIRGEMQRVIDGEFDPLDNPLKNAPHTAAELVADIWTHQYSREQAAYPLPELRSRKYWPPVARIDNVYGDRNLFCACPGVDAFREAE
jgi:glycine cleavage system P protein (glycine dehydrogenase)